MLCSTCLRPLEYAFLRKRKKRYTGEDGPATETITVVVGHCLQDGHYSTIFSDEIVKNKQYCIADIRSVLENKADCSLASPRTRAYWKSWFRGVWDAVIQNIQRYIGSTVSENDIASMLHAFLKKCGEDWLRYVLDLFSTECNNLCMFFDLISPTIGIGSEKLRKLHVDEGVATLWRGTKPP